MIDSLDRSITLLLENGRMRNSAIARLVGVAENTARNRNHRLAASGAIKVSSVLEPSKADFQANAMISVSAEVGKLHDVARAFVDRREVRYVGIATGDYCLFIEAMFQRTMTCSTSPPTASQPFPV